MATATNIDDLSILLLHFKHISNKHRCLQVKPEHHTIVGKYLLKAISKVRGDAAISEIHDAWGEAHGEIADIFISAEPQEMQNTSRPIVWIQLNYGDTDKLFRSHVDRILKGVSSQYE